MPPHLTTLSVSWLNKQFKAVAVHRGSVDGTWENPSDVEGASHFEALVREAVQKTGYRGQTVTLLLGHQRLAQQIVDIPPVKGATVNKLVARQAAQQKYFVGEAAWAFQRSVTAKGSQRVILHLFPRILLNQLVQACERNGLHLVSVMPPSAVVHEQLVQLPLSAEETSLLAAETGGATTLVIGKADGSILLSRTLAGTWNEDPERLGVDLARTMAFASQQYGAAVTKNIWVFGPGAKETTHLLQRQLQVPIQLSPTEWTPLYWATESLKVPANVAPNFISAEMQRAPQRRVFAKVVAAATAVLFFGAVGVSGYALYQARQESNNYELLNRQYSQLQTRASDLQRRNEELTRKQRIAATVVDGRPAPVGFWFLAYLGEIVPPELVVTNLSIQILGGSNSVQSARQPWRVELKGTFQETGALPPIDQFSKSVAELKRRLAAGPFHLELEEVRPPDRAGSGQTGAAAAKQNWTTRFSTTAPTNEPPKFHFDLAGVMQ
jgi:hypothetical protein